MQPSEKSRSDAMFIRISPLLVYLQPFFAYLTFLVARCKMPRFTENMALCECKLRQTYNLNRDAPKTPGL